MAGIGFELRKLLVKENLTSWLQAYAYAGIIGSGPWVISIVALIIVGFLSYAVVVPGTLITQFQVTVTWLIAGSLTLTGLMQLLYTRFIADSLFRREAHKVLPTFHGLLLLTTVVSGSLSLPFALFCFPAQTLAYRILFMACFVLLANIWIATTLLSGLKEYKQVVGLYLLGYSVGVASSLVLRPSGLEGLLLGFAIGQTLLLAGMMLLVARYYPSHSFLSFDFLPACKVYPSLMTVGFLYNLGIWADKFIFWMSPDTSSAIIGPLRASEIYDLPIFMAYLSIIPGMAVFLLRMETDFVEYYDKFYDAVRTGASLEYIESMRNEMVWTARQGLTDIIKIQSIAVVAIFIAGPPLLRWLRISDLYESLLYIDVIAAGLQVVFLGLLNVFFYLDQRRSVLFLTALFAISNIAFTTLTLHLGAPWFGYGFAISLLLVVVLGLLILDRKLEDLEYETFMLQ